MNLNKKDPLAEFVIFLNNIDYFIGSNWKLIESSLLLKGKTKEKDFEEYFKFKKSIKSKEILYLRQKRSYFEKLFGVSLYKWARWSLDKKQSKLRNKFTFNLLPTLHAKTVLKKIREYASKIPREPLKVSCGAAFKEVILAKDPVPAVNVEQTREEIAFDRFKCDYLNLEIPSLKVDFSPEPDHARRFKIGLKLLRLRTQEDLQFIEEYNKQMESKKSNNDTIFPTTYYQRTTDTELKARWDSLTSAEKEVYFRV